jgi:hypothetical protein
VAQPLDRLADSLVGQAVRGEVLLEGHVGQQVQRPGTAGLAEPSGGLVEETPERVGLGLAEDRSGVPGAALLLPQATRSLLLEGVEGVADGSDGATDPCGDPGRSLAVGTGQEDLGASEGERLAAPEPGLEFQTLRVGEFSNEQRWFHDPLFGPTTPTTRNRMRLH